MRIDDIILALQRGVDPNAAVLAQATAPGFPPVQAPDASPAPLSAPVMNPPIPTPRPATAPPPPPAPPPAAGSPASPPTPVTNPTTPDETPRIMKSPPDLSNMYIELIKKSQNAAALDSGLATIAAGFSKYPENRAALLSQAGSKTGQQNLSMADIAKIQELQIKNQALGIRQAAKAGLMKQYGLSRDTVDYLDADGKLDEVIKHKNTGTLITVTDPATGKTHMVDNATGRTISTIETGVKPSEDQVALDKINKERPPDKQLTMEDYIKTVKREPRAAANEADVLTLAAINKDRPADKQITMEDYLKTIKREPRAPANEQDELNLAAINRGRPPDKPMTMEEYLTNVKRAPGVSVNVGTDGTTYPKPAEGYDYLRYPPGHPQAGKVQIGPDGKPVQYKIEGGPAPAEARKTEAGAAEAERKNEEALRKENKAKIQQVMAANNIGAAAMGALGIVNVPGVTGFGSDIRRIIAPGGDPVRNYDSFVKSIDANTAIAALQQMREASSTGGALGNVTDFENRMLASTIANLRHDVSPDVAEKNLIRINAMFQTMLEQRYDDKLDPDAAKKFNAALQKNIEELSVEHQNRKHAAGTSKYKITPRSP